MGRHPKSPRTHSEHEVPGAGRGHTWFLITRAHDFDCALGLTLVIVLPAPGAHLVKTFVGLTALIGTVAAILFVMTFWAKVRVRIGRLNLRYKLVRRRTGSIAVLGLSFLSEAL